MREVVQTDALGMDRAVLPDAQPRSSRPLTLGRQKSASLPNFLACCPRNWLQGDGPVAGYICHARNWNFVHCYPATRIVTVLPMRILRLRRATHLHLTSHCERKVRTQPGVWNLLFGVPVLLHECALREQL